MEHLLTKLVGSIEALPYHEGKAFEDACESIFQDCGFVNIRMYADENVFKQFEYFDDVANDETQDTEITLIREDRFSELRFLELYSDHLYYMAQPCGVTNPPDFILVIYGRVVPFECKSSQKKNFRYNNTLPHPTTIYAYTSKTHNETAVALGRDVIPHTTGLLIEEFTKKVRSRGNQEILEFCKTLPYNPYQVKGELREQYGQWGGQKYDDFVTISKKNNWKMGVLLHLWREFRMSDYSKLDNPLL